MECAAETVQDIYHAYLDDLQHHNSEEEDDQSVYPSRAVAKSRASSSSSTGSKSRGGRRASDWENSLKDEDKALLQFIKALCIGYKKLPSEEQVSVFLELIKPPNIEEDVNLDDFVKRELSRRVDPPPELTANLLPFQQEGLAWMCDQEDSNIRGGTETRALPSVSP